MEGINNLAIIQARTGATRLPNKVLLDLCGKSVLEHVIQRVKGSALIDEIIVATTVSINDLKIVSLCAEKSIRVFCGSENDVLDRYYQIAKLIKPQNIIRITADCPLIDPNIIDLVISTHMNGSYDYTSNVLEETYPDGEDVEIMRFSVLEEAWAKANLASQREHLTQYIIHNDKYKKKSITSNIDYSKKRWTLDTPQDFKLIRFIYNELYNNNPLFSMEDILELLKEHTDIEKLNFDVVRNEGLVKSKENDFFIKETGK